MPALINSTLSLRLQQVLTKARAELIVLPQTSEIELFLINSDFSQLPLSADEMQAVMDYPAYWAFCWASGQVLAQYITEHPSLVAGKRVLDFGCGSGVVAIAAAKAGAHSVVACDIDSDALQAASINAKHNQVQLTLLKDFDQRQQPIDLIIAADVLYDRENLYWLGKFLECAEEVLVADSRVKNFNYPPYELIEQRSGTTLPDLDEFDEFRNVRLYYAGGQYTSSVNT
jgi:predicted nicotinamide N-methyase